MAMKLVETIQGSRIHVPLNLKKRSGRKQVVVSGTPNIRDEEGKTEPGAAYRDAMIIAIARGFRWKKLLEDGKYASIRQMAAELGVAAPYMSRIIRLTNLAPEIIEAIVDNKEPDGMSLEMLRRPMPLLWETQWVLHWMRRSSTGVINDW